MGSDGLHPHGLAMEALRKEMDLHTRRSVAPAEIEGHRIEQPFDIGDIIDMEIAVDVTVEDLRIERQYRRGVGRFRKIRQPLETLLPPSCPILLQTDMVQETIRPFGAT